MAYIPGQKYFDGEFEFVEKRNGRNVWKDVYSGELFYAAADATEDDVLDAFDMFTEEGIGKAVVKGQPIERSEKFVTDAAMGGERGFAAFTAAQAERDRVSATGLAAKQEENRIERERLAAEAAETERHRLLLTESAPDGAGGKGAGEGPPERMFPSTLSAFLTSAREKAKTDRDSIKSRDPRMWQPLSGEGDMQYVPRQWKSWIEAGLVTDDVAAFYYHTVAKNGAKQLDDRVRHEATKLKDLKDDWEDLQNTNKSKALIEQPKRTQDIAKQEALIAHVTDLSTRASRVFSNSVSKDISEWMKDPSKKLAIDTNIDWGAYTPGVRDRQISDYLSKWTPGTTPAVTAPTGADTLAKFAEVTGEDAVISNEDLEFQSAGPSGDPTTSTFIKTVNGEQQPLLGGPGKQQTLADIEAEMDAATDPFQTEEIRQLGYQQQTPFTAWTRLGLQGALTPDQTPTTDLSQFAQGAIQDYFGRTAEPEYAAALAAASRRKALGQDPGMQTGFEQFARGVPGQFGVGRVDPGRLGTDRDALIATLRDKTAMEDPYREELLSYLGDIEDPTNKRLLGALGRPTLGQVSPIYRAAARKRMEQRLQNLMAMKPEQTLLSFFAKGAPETRQDWMGMNPLNFETPGRIS